jgi:hypothetical protein
MEALKEIIAGSRLAGVIDLPETFKASELEVIILPLKKDKKKKSTGKIQAKSVNLTDLPGHQSKKKRSKVDKTKSRQKFLTLMEKGIYTLPEDFTFNREELYD